jgi:hypothetical protein
MFLSSHPDRKNERCRKVDHPKQVVWEVSAGGATGSGKRYKRLRKKIVVPVVQAGNVEIRVKGFGGKNLVGG